MTTSFNPAPIFFAQGSKRSKEPLMKNVKENGINRVVHYQDSCWKKYLTIFIAWGKNEPMSFYIVVRKKGNCMNFETMQCTAAATGNPPEMQKCFSRYLQRAVNVYLASNWLAL